ncbi:MAG: type II toxin-antitoxin system HicA family toxin [Ignavibacteriae bacterium]|nr:type II toxin-antitoxin system HicA family toxin [Ignavibacteriota bacterium]
MKRKEFVKMIEKQKCTLYREGGNHSIFHNTVNNKISSVPRHSEIKDLLCKKICKDLGIIFKI